MTEPTHTSTAFSTAVSDIVNSSTTDSAGRSRGEFAVRGEMQNPASGHLPLTVWLAAADTESVSTCQAGCCHPVSGPLARHLIAACTRMGETVIHLGAADHQLVSAALTAGCLPVAVFTDPDRAGVIWTRLARTHPDYDLCVTDLRVCDLRGADRDDDEAPPLLADLARSAGLVVSEQVCDRRRRLGGPCPDEEAQVYDVVSAAGLVRPGGHLAVVTGLHRTDRVVDPLPQIIARARAAGLVYLQHIIALRQPARGDRIEPRRSSQATAAWQELPECAALPASARVHSDVLLFTRLKTPSSSSEVATKPAQPLGGPNASATVTQTGGAR
ncbi:hypothetical protein HII36_42450 [Nonomuraea sp. NN258]|uniref:hypothetical protein n=1 Tax=Nonomuraea antri TaxID=2730852 RepID=UPI0015693871|nr:hypothetical protein [Nonomuraea antri]NRQ38444.1 hypothetical protein [Nonomuraea antri]